MYSSLATTALLALALTGHASESLPKQSPLRALYGHAGWVEVAHGTERGVELFRGTMTHYSNRDIVRSGGAAPGRPFFMFLCDESLVNWRVDQDFGADLDRRYGKETHSGYYNLHAQVFEYAALVSLAAEDAIEIHDDGSLHEATWKMHWVTDVETYRVSSTRTGQGDVKLVLVKTAEEIRSDAELEKSPEELFKFEASLRGHTRAPIGAWWEIVIAGSPRTSSIPSGLSLEGWTLLGQGTFKTIGDLRGSSGKCKS